MVSPPPPPPPPRRPRRPVGRTDDKDCTTGLRLPLRRLQSRQESSSPVTSSRVSRASVSFLPPQPHPSTDSDKFFLSPTRRPPLETGARLRRRRLESPADASTASTAPGTSTTSPAADPSFLSRLPVERFFSKNTGHPPPPPPPLPRCPPRRDAPSARVRLRDLNSPTGSSASHAAPGTATPRAGASNFLQGSTEQFLSQKRGLPPPSDSGRTDEDDEPPSVRRRVRGVLFPADTASSSTVAGRPQTSAGGTSASPAMSLLPSLRSSSSRTGSLPPPASASAPSTSYSQELHWNGPGLHRFTGMANLLQTVRGSNRFLRRREELCILQNARFFQQRGIINDACDDPCRPDFSFFVVNRLQYLEMASRAGALQERFWLGYKENYYEMSKEKRISTLKVNDNTFLWRHEVSGSRLLRRRISLDNDMGPFEDDSRVFYILQYHKLARMKKEKKAVVLAERARHGYF